MKKFLLSVLAATTMFAACTTESTTDAVSVPVPDVLTVSLEEDTRMQLMNEKTVWNEGDFVSVFYKSNANQKWQFNGVTGDRSGELTCVEAGVATAEMEKVVVVYPYDANYLVTPSTGAIETTLPAEQSYLEGSYGLGSSMMISSGYYRQFTLKNVMGWLKLQLTGDGEKVTKVVFRGNNGEQVAGNVYVEADDATLILSSTEAEAGEATGGTLSFENSVVTELTLNCNGVALGAEATSFYLALPPQTFENGFTVEVYAENADYEEVRMVKSTENALTIERNAIQPLESVVFEGKPTTIYAQFNAAEGMDLSMMGLNGWYVMLSDAKDYSANGSLLFVVPSEGVDYEGYLPTSFYAPLNGTFDQFNGGISFAGDYESAPVPCVVCDPSMSSINIWQDDETYTTYFLKGTDVAPDMDSLEYGVMVQTAMPTENRNFFNLYLPVVDAEGNEYTLVATLNECEIMGYPVGGGAASIPFSLTEFGFTEFELSYDENSETIVYLTSSSNNGLFKFELDTASAGGDICYSRGFEAGVNMYGGWTTYLEATEENFDFVQGRVLFEKVEGTENKYTMSVLRTLDGGAELVMSNGKLSYAISNPEETGYYELTINFPEPELEVLYTDFTKVDVYYSPAENPMLTGMAHTLSLSNADDSNFAILNFVSPDSNYLHGEYTVMNNILALPETNTLLGDGYSTITIGGVEYLPVSGTITAISLLAMDMGEDNNAFAFNMVVADASGKQYQLVTDGEGIVGPVGYKGGSTTTAFNIVERELNVFNATVSEDGSIVSLKSDSANWGWSFELELSGLTGGNIVDTDFSVLSGNLVGGIEDWMGGGTFHNITAGTIWFTEGEDADATNDYVMYVMAGEQLTFGTQYHLDYSMDAPGVPVTINFPAPALPEVVTNFDSVMMYAAPAQNPALTGIAHAVILTEAANDNNFAQLQFIHTEGDFLSGEYPVMNGIAQLPETNTLLGDGMSYFEIDGVAYYPVSGSVYVATGMPDVDVNAFTFDLVVADDNNNQYKLTANGEGVVGEIGYTGSSTTAFNIVERELNVFNATVSEDGSIVSLKSDSANWGWSFELELSGLTDGNIVGPDFSVLSGNLVGGIEDWMGGSTFHNITAGTIWFTEGEDADATNDYVMYVMAGEQLTFGTQYHLDYSMDAPGIPVTINFPVVEEPEPTQTVVYLNPDPWAVDGAWFAAYLWNDAGDTWVKATDEDADGIYEVVVPDGYTSVIFVRMNNAKTALSWDSKWNQTNDLVVPTDGTNLYTITAWGNGTDVCPGAWSTR